MWKHSIGWLMSACTVVISSSASGQPLTTYPTYQMFGTGDPANRVNIVVLSSGYTAAELGPGSLFEQDVDALIDLAFTLHPLDEYSQYFNVYRIEVPSAQSGSATGPGNPDFAFQTYIVPGTIQVIVELQELASDIAKYNVPELDIRSSSVFEPHDIQIVMVNRPNLAAGSGGTPAGMTNRRQNWPYMFLHEAIGHSFALFEHEFVDISNELAECSDPTHTFPNTRNAQRWSPQNPTLFPLKWGAWIEPGTELPTQIMFPPVDPRVGLWSGANTCGDHRNVYKPRFRSVMSAPAVASGGTLEFAGPHGEFVIQSIYQQINMLREDLRSPVSSEVRMGSRRTVDFTMVLDTLQTDSYSVNGLLSSNADGNPTVLGIPGLVGDETIILTHVGSGSAEPGSMVYPGESVTVSGVAIDSTPLVRSDPNNDMVDSTAWTLEVVCTGDCNSNGVVSQSEENLAVQLLLDNQPLTACPSADDDGDGEVSAREISDIVSNKIFSCSTAFVEATPSPHTTILTAGDTGAGPGQVADVAIALSGGYIDASTNGNQVAILRLDLEYDPGLVAPTNPLNPCALDVALANHTIVSSVAATGSGAERIRMFVSDTVNPRWHFENGVVATCQFSVASNATPGTEVPISVTNVELIGNITRALQRNQVPLDVVSTDGNITVCPGCGCE